MPRKPRDYPARDPSADGFGPRFENYALTHFEGLWKFISSVPWLRKRANKEIINIAVMRTRTRPSPYGSMAVRGESDNPMAGYASWESMTDQTWFARHLPISTLGQPGDSRGPLPELDRLRKLFEVAPGEETMSETSSVLFLSFAQWFTDGFLMTDLHDHRKTHTSHQIDFNPLYGLSRRESDAVRLRSEDPGKKGRLKTQVIDGAAGEFAPFYYDENGEVKPEFAALRSPIRIDEYFEKVGPERTAELKKTIFAFAGERANSTPFTAMMNILFLREHNRLAGLLEAAYPDWDDERVFQTARNINIVLLIKIVVEEYINHISPNYFQLDADPSVCWHAQWNKPNWGAIEFNLLYRWHSLTPSHFEIEGEKVHGGRILFNNSYLMKLGLGKAMQTASEQRAWNVGLLNTPDFLVDVELASVRQGRENQLATYNDYREAFGLGRVKEFNQITGDPRRIELLKELYDNDVDKIEYFVGLFAEDVEPRSAIPPLITRMVAQDAFSQALTNPLISEHAFNAETFSELGMDVIANTNRLQHVLDRNLMGDTNEYQITMTLEPYQ